MNNGKNGKNKPVTGLNLPDTTYKEVVKIANELAKLENRTPHDSIRVLIEEEGRKKIKRLKAEKAKL